MSEAQIPEPGFPENIMDFSDSSKIINDVLNNLADKYNNHDFSVTSNEVDVNFVPYLIEHIDASDNPSACADVLVSLARYTDARVNNKEALFTADADLDYDNLPEQLHVSVNRTIGRLPSSPAFIGELVLDTIIHIEENGNLVPKTVQNLGKWKSLGLGVLISLYKEAAESASD
jgi:hypothetical protein